MTIPMNLIVHSNQEAFDAAVKYFKSRVYQCGIFLEPIVDEDNRQPFQCMYWNDGDVCLIGALVERPEELASYKVNIKGLVSNGVLDIRGFNPDLLFFLQLVHDERRFWDKDGFNLSGWDYLFNIALRFQLDDKELTNAIGQVSSVLQSDNSDAPEDSIVDSRSSEEVLEAMPT